MLLTFKDSAGRPLARLGDTERRRMELVQARSEGDEHFFVLLNRVPVRPRFMTISAIGLTTTKS
jgi:hypothetical protein